MRKDTKVVAIRRSDKAAICGAGRPIADCFPPFFDSKNNLTASCANQVRWYNRSLNSKYYGQRDPKSALMPGDIIDVFEIELVYDQNVLHVSPFKPVGSLLFDDQKKKPGMRWL